MIAPDDIAPRFAVLSPMHPEQLARGMAAADAPGAGFQPFGEDGLSFADMLDIVNPLQHLPVVGTLYRHLTGDTIAPLPRIVGATLFGGPIGAFVGIANVAAERETGSDLGDHVLAWLQGGPSSPAEPEPAVAVMPPWNVTGDAASPPTALAARPAVVSDATTFASLGASESGGHAPFASALDHVAGPEQHGLSTPADGSWHDDEAAYAANHVAQLNGDGLHQDAARPSAAGPGAGATAAEGGWFARSLMTGLAKYHEAQALQPERDGGDVSGRFGVGLDQASNGVGTAGR